MAWGCKAKPNGCKWAYRVDYPAIGQQEWWCELCERDGMVAIPIEQPEVNSPCPTDGS